ncbi:MAG: hypothetical protein N2202_05900 [Proteobacteria bacterium]|nr:hypothetical protein [Pseudomonadota bacterium]
MNNIKDKKLFLILGDKSFQQEKIRFILSSFFEGNIPEQNIEFYSQNRHDWNIIKEQILTYSLFGTPRFFILEETDIFTSEKNIKELLDTAKELYISGEFEKAYKSILSAFLQLDINELDYQKVSENPSNITKFFNDYIDNSDFCIELLKRFKLPEKLPHKYESTDLENIITKIPDGHYLIITTSNFDKRKKIFKDLQKRAVVYEQISVKKEGYEFKKNIDNYIKDIISNWGKKISADNLVLLQELCYESKYFEKNLEKLLILTKDIDEISRNEILLAFDDDAIVDSKMLSQFIKEKNFFKIITLITNPTSTKQDHIKLLGYIRSLIKNGIALKEIFEDRSIKDYSTFVNYLNRVKENYANKSLLQQHPFYLFQSYQTFFEYEKDFLISLYIKLFEIDKDMKSTQKNTVDLLIDFFSSMFNPRK